jgi:hypothetical protein
VRLPRLGLVLRPLEILDAFRVGELVPGDVGGDEEDGDTEAGEEIGAAVCGRASAKFAPLYSIAAGPLFHELMPLCDEVSGRARRGQLETYTPPCVPLRDVSTQPQAELLRADAPVAKGPARRGQLEHGHGRQGPHRRQSVVGHGSSEMAHRR